MFAFLVATILLFLVVGLFLEGIAAMLVLVPILHPIAVSLGIDPTHYGIVVIFNLMIGLISAAARPVSVRRRRHRQCRHARP